MCVCPAQLLCWGAQENPEPKSHGTESCLGTGDGLQGMVYRGKLLSAVQTRDWIPAAIHCSFDAEKHILSNVP